MTDILTEVSNLSPSDCLKVAERYKTNFDYPLHRHSECEINFVYNAPGVRRVIGDSVETIGNLDLVLISGENLEHVWEQGECTSSTIREITIHFPQDLIHPITAARSQFASIKEMLVKARFGVTFPEKTILSVYGILDTFTKQPDPFFQLLDFLKLLYLLSLSDYRVLASKSFAMLDDSQQNIRLAKVRKYVMDHLERTITLKEAADVAGMTPTAFSRFFKNATGETFVTYLTGLRLGHAQRELVDTDKNVSQICYESGFSNLSNFNRAFRARRGMTPTDFRQIYKKNKITI